MYNPKSSLFEAFFTTLPPCGWPSVAQRSRLSASLRRARPHSSLLHLRGLDSLCSVNQQPAPEGTRSRRCGRRQTAGGGSRSAGEQDVGTASAAPAERASFPPPHDSPCLLLARRTCFMGITFVSPCRCASSSRGVGPAGVGTSTSFSISA